MRDIFNQEEMAMTSQIVHCAVYNARVLYALHLRSILIHCDFSGQVVRLALTSRLPLLIAPAASETAHIVSENWLRAALKLARSVSNSAAKG
ncbi:hypothetical protein [Agrobacterium vitis]|uniref:hypothetical protein n=1 Tax=Agrobacterium vitis TaxID=373 RepID=UPI0015DA1195|nr:hypothetical protein [Agrobacterium vitis]